jgi:Rrf2 family transcriptional regulator, repressor of oqxAB
MIDVRCPTALQIMPSVALAEQQSVPYLTSPLLAETVGANPNFVHKRPALLVQNELLRSQMGNTGGVRLAQPAAEITLRDICRAVMADSEIWGSRTGTPHRCLVSPTVPGYFEKLIDEAQVAISPCSGDLLCHTRSPS